MARMDGEEQVKALLELQARNEERIAAQERLLATVQADLKDARKEAGNKENNEKRSAIIRDRFTVGRSTEEKFIKTKRPATELFYVGSYNYYFNLFNEKKNPDKDILEPIKHGIVLKFDRFEGPGADARWFPQFAINLSGDWRFIAWANLAYNEMVNVTEEDIGKYNLDKDTRVRNTGEYSIEECLNALAQSKHIGDPNFYVGERYRKTIENFCRIKWAREDIAKEGAEQFKEFEENAYLLKSANEPTLLKAVGA